MVSGKDWLLLASQLLTLYLVFTSFQLGAVHVSLCNSRKAALVLTPRGGPWLVLTAHAPDFVIGKCPREVLQGA